MDISAFRAAGASRANWTRRAFACLYLVLAFLRNTLLPMVFVTATGEQSSYYDTYHSILARYRRSPATSASSVTVLVAPDVDAVCAARMLQELFRQDDVLHRIVPVSGMEALEQQRDALVKQTDVRISLYKLLCLIPPPRPAAHVDITQHGIHS